DTGYQHECRQGVGTSPTLRRRRGPERAISPYCQRRRIIRLICSVSAPKATLRYSRVAITPSAALTSTTISPDGLWAAQVTTTSRASSILASRMLVVSPAWPLTSSHDRKEV